MKTHPSNFLEKEKNKFKKHSSLSISPREEEQLRTARTPDSTSCNAMHTTASAPDHTPVPPLDTTPSPRFDLADPIQALAFDTHLHQHGYAVVASVASNTQILRSRSLFWDALESMPPTTQISRHDPTTWYSTKEHPWLPSPRNGIVSNIGQSEFCWSLRTLPAVQHAFQRIWNNTNEPMICSFDGGAAFRPWQRDEQWLTDGGWWHMDQNGQRKGKQCVQGLVSLYDANETTGGLCVIPGSHLAFEAVTARQSQTPMDFVPVRKGDEILNGGKLVVCKAGDLIVWDSRTVHCNTPASCDVVANALKNKATPQNDAPAHLQQTQTQKKDSGATDNGTDEHNELIRLVAYVCMVPRSFASDKTIAMRKKAFETNTQTSHWPHHNIMARPMPDGSNRRDWDSAPANVRALVIGSKEEQKETRCTIM